MGCSKNKKRIVFAALVVTGIIAMTGCGKKEDGKLKVRIAHDNNVNTPLHKAFLKYEELVEERSDGKIDVILLPGSQMGSVQDTFEQCRRGDIEMSGSTTSNFTQAIPELAAWESFYLFDDSAHAKRVFESEMGKKMMEPVTETIAQTMIDIVDVISDYDNGRNAIGYSYYYYATTMYSSDTMKFLSINGTAPTYDNIKTGLYDIQTAYYAVIRKDEPEDSDARKLLDLMKSERGQNVAKEAGYVQNY